MLHSTSLRRAISSPCFLPRLRPRLCPPLSFRAESTSVPPGPSSPIPSLNVDTTQRHLHPSRSIDTSEFTLADIIRKTIDAVGPMPVQRYMSLCLTHPTLGYYTRGDVFGKQGDFITSPEISQVFGELMAIWFVTRWQANGSPSRVRLLELGPGRGTLMADILRTFKSFPAVAQAVEAVDLVEMSPAMRDLQKASLPEGTKIRWWDDIKEVPDTDAFTFFVAHEFFDALPIHILERSTSTEAASVEAAGSATTDAGIPPTPLTKGPFHELLINHKPPSPSLHLTLSPKPTPHSIHLPTTSPHFDAVEAGERVEICPGAFSVMRPLAELLVGEEEGKGGGCGLVIDYGRDGLNGESLRAFKDHAPISPFETPGFADLTANVDFRYLREAVTSSPVSSSLRVLGPIPQGEFLTALGLWPRVERLVEHAKSDERKELLREGGKRLVDRGGMGGEYLVMGVESARIKSRQSGGDGGSDGNAFGGPGEDVYPFLSKTG